MFAVFERYDLADPAERPTYAAIARDLGVTPATVTNHLAAMRRQFRRHVLDRLRDLTTSRRGVRSRSQAAARWLVMSTWLANTTVAHLRDVAEWPDLGERYEVTRAARSRRDGCRLRRARSRARSRRGHQGAGRAGRGGDRRVACKTRRGSLAVSNIRASSRCTTPGRWPMVACSM